MFRSKAELRKYTQWLPVVVLTLCCAAWFSPLGVFVAFFLALGVALVLDRFGLAAHNGQYFPAAGGAWLQSAKTFRKRAEPEKKDIALSASEIGMGGPTYACWLLRDGAIVGDISSGWHDVGTNGMRIAQADARDNLCWVVYDENLKQLTTFSDPAEYWKLLHQRDGAANERLTNLLPYGETQAFRHFRGLWLPDSHPAVIAPPAEWLEAMLPSGRRLTAKLLLPEDLRMTFYPDRSACTHPYELYLDDEPTGRHVSGLTKVRESRDGRCFIVKGGQLNSDLLFSNPLWHVHRAGRWTALQASVCRPYRGGGMYRVFDTRIISLGNDAEVVLEGHACTFTSEGVEHHPLDETYIEQPVEWREQPLLLPVSSGRFKVQIPPVDALTRV